MAMTAAGRIRVAAPMVLLGLLLAGCGSQPPIAGYTGGASHYLAGHPMYRVGAPYEIKGIWYYPAVDYNYDKTGVASWYGEQFNGRYTANGEIFDLNQLTAAHTTLPMPSIVEVTNLQNGRSLQLRVNDRGPFVDRRLIDVSRRAAQLLGFESRGTTPVRVRIVKDASIQVAEEAMHNSGGTVMVAAAPSGAPRIAAAPLVIAGNELPAEPPNRPPSALASNVIAGPIVDTQPILDTQMPSLPERAASPRPLPAPEPARPIADTQMPPLPERVAPERVAAVPVESSGRIFVQAGAFAMIDNAQRVQSRIAPLGMVRVMTASVNGIEIYRVRLGPLSSVEQADRLLARVVGSGYPQARIVTD